LEESGGEDAADGAFLLDVLLESQKVAEDGGLTEYKLTKREKKWQKFLRKRENRRLKRKTEKQKRKERRSEAESSGSVQTRVKEEKEDVFSPTQQKQQRTLGLVHQPRLVIDMGLGSRLEDKEVRSVANQVQMAYGWMRSKCHRPLELHLTSLNPRMESALQRHAGYPRWRIGKHQVCYSEVFEEEVDKLLYLSPDAPEVLQEIDPDKIYIIGGIADTHIQKGLTLRKAQDQGIATACFPLKQYEASKRSVLNINHVVEIMATVAETGDWKLAFECTIPKRKAYHHDGRAEYCTKSVDTHPRETDS